MKKLQEISGWFNYQETFNFLLSKVPDSGTFIECGAWLCQSSANLYDEAVKKNISYWTPKVKNGGYVAGHDYDFAHSGVMQAVDEAFGKDNVKVIGNCWIAKKENK